MPILHRSKQHPVFPQAVKGAMISMKKAFKTPPFAAMAPVVMDGGGIKPSHRSLLMWTHLRSPGRMCRLSEIKSRLLARLPICQMSSRT